MEDLAVNPCCLLSSVPDQTIWLTQGLLRREIEKKNPFKKPLNQPLLNEQHGCQDLFVSQMALFSGFALDLPPAACFSSISSWLMCPPSSSPCPLSFSTYLFSINPASLFLHHPIFTLSSYSSCMYYCEPSPHLARQRFFIFRKETDSVERAMESTATWNKPIRPTFTEKERSWLNQYLYIIKSKQIWIKQTDLQVKNVPLSQLVSWLNIRSCAWVILGL